MNYPTLKKEYFKKKTRILKRIEEFSKIPEEKWKDEMIFCTLTPQSNALKCWGATKQIKQLKKIDENSIKNILKSKTRFHNNKTKYLLHNLENWNNNLKEIKSNLNNPLELRNILSKRIKGYGLKESSHFLRNIGLSNNKIAILDRHILKNLKELGIIKEPLIKNKKDYLEKEESFKKFSKNIGIPMDHLDLLFWSKENGKIFK